MLGAEIERISEAALVRDFVKVVCGIWIYLSITKGVNSQSSDKKFVMWF